MAQNLGGRIAELLTQYNMTQRELADKAGITEVSMSRYIKGDRVSQRELLWLILPLPFTQPLISY